MKLIKQVSLSYQEGTSDKVYEVDLCEVTVAGGQPAQFVVNFRYGRRGTTLRDGTKTAAPVARHQAETIFTKLVDSKLAKGYRYVAGSDRADGGAAPPSPTPPPDATAPRPLDPRARAVLQRLADGHQSDSNWPLSRAAWRAGELRLTQAEPLLLGLIGTGSFPPDASRQPPPLDYSIAAALARCGSARSIPSLRKMLSDKTVGASVRRMAAEALLRVLDEASRAELIQNTISRLPEPLVESARQGPADTFAAKLQDHLQNGGNTLILDTLYRVDNEHVRPALIDSLRTAPLKPPYFQRLRHIFKAAEVRGDGEVFGVLAYRFETTRANFRANNSYYYDPPPKKTIGPNAEQAYSLETRMYLRRRVARRLQRLGEAVDADYVKMAVGVLLPFTDDDALSPRIETRYVYSSDSMRGGRYVPTTVHYDRYAAYLAFNQILYGDSPRYRPDSARRYFECVPPYQPGGAEPAGREESFPELWEAAPQGLLHLLDESRCEAVHQFAAKALRACRDFCSRLGVDVLLMLLGAPYEATVGLGLDLAVSRYDPTHPDHELVLALANCSLERARAKAHQWIGASRIVFFSDTEFTVALVASPHADTRTFARDTLRGLTLDDAVAQAIIGRLIATLQSLGEEDGPLAADVAETLLRVFGRQLRQIGPDVIRDLLAHPLPEVQRFAGDLVLDHDRLAAEPPEDVLRALLNAGHAPVRQVGVKIIGQLPDDVLRRSVELLFALSRSEHPDVREAVRPVVQRLVAADRGFAERLGGMFVEAMLVPGAPEGVPSHTGRLLIEDLRDYLGAVSPELVFKLLQSRSGPAQEVGGVLLTTNVPADELSVVQIVKLAGHDILTVRQAAWQMCRDEIDRLRGEAAAAVKLLDAKWDDSRQFGFGLFREHFGQSDLTPAVLVAICDSVRPEVQQFGREMITRFFQEELGQEYLLRLSEHPAAPLQMFATNFLDRYAADRPDRLRELTPYFISVLSRVNRGRVAKDRVLAFLEREAVKSEEAAQIVAGILNRQSATSAIGDKARTIEIMVRVRAAYPEIRLPLTVQPVEVRGGV